MKKIYLLFLSSILIAANSFAQTTIPGGNVSGTWTLSGSPYNVQGSIRISNDSTLTIQPGVTVNFQGNYKLLVLGRLLAVGTVVDTITFTAADTTIGWRGIRFDSTTVNNDTSKIVFCKLQYGKATAASPDDNGGAIYIYYFSKVIVLNSTIINCLANNSGGGIYIQSGSPLIKRNLIFGNNSLGNNMSGGGGIFCSNDSSLINDNIITNNNDSVGSMGGGIYCANNSHSLISNNAIDSNGNGGIYVDASYPVITSNSISYNTSANFTGGINCQYGSPVISNNTISHNTGFNGAGIYSSGNTTPTIISNNIISYNIALYGGGGIYCYYDSAAIFNNTISNNSSPYGGGGIFFQGGRDLVSNNTITNNSSVGNGGGIYYWTGSNPNLINNTVANNHAANGGGMYLTDISNPVLRNNILWGNTADTSGAQLFLNDEGSDPNFFYCDVQGGTAAFGLNGNFYTGTYQNNIDALPLFVAPSGGTGTTFNGVTADWSLQSSSPCINTGDPAGAYPATDKAGNPRVAGGRIDMGAYEFQSGAGVMYLAEQITVVKIYPNPVSDEVSIELLNNGNNINELSILNTLGEVEMAQRVGDNVRKATLSLQSLSAGIYFVKIQSKEGITTGKIIKE